MYAGLTSITDTDVTFDVKIRDEAREGEPARHVVHIHATYPGPHLALSMLEAHSLSAALTAAFEERDRQEQDKLDTARRDARERIGVEA